MNLKDRARQLPECPGVYIFKDSIGIIIYVGKSKNLKSRVSSYFSSLEGQSSKLENLMRNLNDFEFITTDTEFEALILECELIQKHKPAYNRLMKNPKSYCYLKLDLTDDCPEFEIVYDKYEDKNLYIGPFTSKSMVSKALLVAKEAVGIMCNKATRRNSPCINSSLNLCNGFCFGKISTDEYRKSIDTILELFTGSQSAIIIDLTAKMNKASELLDFETAAKFKDNLSAIKYLIGSNKMQLEAQKSKNFIVYQRLNQTSFKILVLVDSRIIFKRKYDYKNTSELLSVIIAEIDAALSHETLQNPCSLTEEKFILDARQIIYRYLSTQSNNCRYFTIQNNQPNYDYKNWLQKTIMEV